MKNRAIFSLNTDVMNVEIDGVNADVALMESGDGSFKMEYSKARNIAVGVSGESVILSQRKYPFSKWKSQKINVFIPSHTVPNVKIRAKNGTLSVTGGIYGELNCLLGGGDVRFKSADFAAAQITGEGVDAKIDDVTVKGNLSLQIEKGNLLAENTFATRLDCSAKRGNIGLAFVKCKDCSFNTVRGNITATIVGSEGAFNTTLITREGTINREGATRDSADGNIIAYAERGNIVLTFSEEALSLPETEKKTTATQAGAESGQAERQL